MKKISVVIPMYFEEEVAEECYNRVKKTLNELNNYEHEIIIINDGSKDKTLEIISKIAEKDKNVKIISFSRNFGHQAAVVAGLKHTVGDAVVIIDADLQDPPELIKDMIDLWEKGNEVIYAKRTKRNGESAFKLMTASMFYKILHSLSTVEIPRDTGDFRMADRKVIDVINSLPEHNKFLRGLFSWVGFKQTPLEYERSERFAGKTKYSLKKMVALAKDGIFGFSTKPLNLIGILGIISIVISFVILIYSLVSYFLNANTLTFELAFIMFGIPFFAGVQLVSLWIMSVYISKIYDESQNRPGYIIDKKINID